MASANLNPEADWATSADDTDVHLRGVDWEGYETILRLRGERRFPRLLYLDGNLTFESHSIPHEVQLHEIDWEGFQTILRLRGDRPSFRIRYLDGDLTLVSPSMPHECRSQRIGYFVRAIAEGLGVPFVGIGSTILGREVLGIGVEGDQAFYLSSLGAVRGKVKLDLNVDPPPDLAIEVVVTHDATHALEIYRRLGVPEVWVRTHKALTIFRLGRDGAYAESAESGVFPTLRAEDIFGWVDQPMLIDESDWIARLRDWVVEVLAPRARGGGDAGVE